MTMNNTEKRIPDSLNGYQVVAAIPALNIAPDAYAVVVRRGTNDYVNAIWTPRNGDTWENGRYDFANVIAATRNAILRTTLADMIL